MKKIILLILCCACLPMMKEALAFCGFYVAQADTKLFNESSQVIIVKDGNQMTVTMANDYKGESKDFAMVVPVPVVLQKADIRIKENTLFERFSAYSAPRLTEYYDQNPCYGTLEKETMYAPKGSAAPTTKASAPATKKDSGVKIEAQYQVGEYDILILSATESSGLERWLTENGYKIPKGAQEVLAPYIKAKLKFFVVKVNLSKQTELGYNYLRPIQISYASPQYMLPIRLGMANSKGVQDLIIYTITKKGRTETTNYRTVKMTTDQEIPTFVRGIFGEFYKAVFQRKWISERKNVVFLEYAWDIGVQNTVKCDPCPSPPVGNYELTEAGVNWLNNEPNQVFFTRLHVRYDRAHFPQDLTFQETPNKDRFQCRYVMHQPARGDLDCEEGKEYTRKRIAQQEKELENLYALTGWAHIADFDEYKKSIVDINTYNIDKSKLDVEKNMDTYRPSPESHRKVVPDSVVRSVAPRPTHDLPMPSVDSILPSPEHAPSSSDTIVEKEVLQKVENTPSSSTPWFLIIGVLAASFLGTLGAGIFLRRKNKS